MPNAVIENWYTDIILAVVGESVIPNPMPLIDITQDRIDGVMYALHSLDSRSRDVLLLRYRDGLSREECRGPLGDVSFTRVFQLEHRALMELRKPGVKPYIQFGYKVGSELASDRQEGIDNYIYSINNGLDAKCDIPIEELNFSVRTYNCLRRGGIETIEDLLNRSHSFLTTIRGLGSKAIVEVYQKLHDMGFKRNALGEDIGSLLTRDTLIYNRNKSYPRAV